MTWRSEMTGFASSSSHYDGAPPYKDPRSSSYTGYASNSPLTTDFYSRQSNDAGKDLHNSDLQHTKDLTHSGQHQNNPHFSDTVASSYKDRPGPRTNWSDALEASGVAGTSAATGNDATEEPGSPCNAVQHDHSEQYCANSVGRNPELVRLVLKRAEKLRRTYADGSFFTNSLGGSFALGAAPDNSTPYEERREQDADVIMMNSMPFRETSFRRRDFERGDEGGCAPPGWSNKGMGKGADCPPLDVWKNIFVNFRPKRYLAVAREVYYCPKWFMMRSWLGWDFENIFQERWGMGNPAHLWVGFFRFFGVVIRSNEAQQVNGVGFWWKMIAPWLSQ